MEAPARFELSRTSVRSEFDKKSYGVYTIQCTTRDGKTTWNCEKRYSDFVALRKALLREKCEKVKQLEQLPHGQGRFPKKRGKSADPAVMAMRREGFAAWLGLVVTHYSENPNVCAFFITEQQQGIDRRCLPRAYLPPRCA